MKLQTALTVFSLSLVPGIATSATVAHWKFEPGGFLADSAGSSTLTAAGTVDQVTYPSSGRGDDFPTGHLAGTEFSTTGEYLGATMTPLAGDFSVEAFLNLDSYGGGSGFHWGSLIAGAFSSSNINSGTWYFEVRTDSSFGTSPGELRLGIVTPSGFTTGSSSLTIAPNKDYYVAAIADLGPTGSITYFAKNLTDSGPLLTTVAPTSATGFAFSYASVWVGETPDSFNFLFDGIIDEIRISDSALAPSELLISAVPIPPAIALFAPALMLLAARRRR